MAFEISPRLLVLQALSAHLEGMTVSEEGYDLSGKVYRGISVAGENRGDTFLTILESPRPDILRYGGEYGEVAKEGQWMLLLSGRTVDDPLNPSDPAYNMMWAVQRRLAMLTATKPNTGNPVHPDLFLLGRKVGAIDWGPGIVRPLNEEVSASVNFFLPVRLQLAGKQG